MSFDYAAARQTMVETQVRPNDVTDPAIQSAMRQVAREASCGANTHLAYADTEVQYAPGLWLLRPRDMGKLLQGVRPGNGENALAIAAPYGAALLEAMGLKVELASDPSSISGQYDVIICEGAVSRVPQAWLDALAPGGRLGVIVREGAVGKARIYSRSEDGIGVRDIFESAAATLPGFEPVSAFAF